MGLKTISHYLKLTGKWSTHIPKTLLFEPPIVVFEGKAGRPPRFMFVGRVCGPSKFMFFGRLGGSSRFEDKASVPQGSCLKGEWVCHKVHIGRESGCATKVNVCRESKCATKFMFEGEVGVPQGLYLKWEWLCHHG